MRMIGALAAFLLLAAAPGVGAEPSAKAPASPASAELGAIAPEAPKPKGSVTVSFVSPDERREETVVVTLAPIGPEGPGRPVAERRVVLPPGPKDAKVVFGGVARGSWAVRWDGARVAGGGVRVTVTDGPVDAGRQLLRLGLSVAGSVRDDLGTPLGGARVALSERSSLERRSTFHAEARTAADGGFTIEGAPDGTPLLWSASAAGCMEATGLLGGETRLEIVLDRAQRVSGRVVDLDGKPLPEARIEVRYLREGWSTTGRDRVAVSEAGAFAFDRESPLAAVVELRAKGFRLAEKKLEALARPGAARELPLGDVVLDRGRTLRGRVTDAATGAAVPGASLNATSRREERDRIVTDEQETTSGEDGTFAVEGIATDGPVRLVARLAGWAPKTLEIEPGTDDADVEVALRRGGRVEGRLCGRPFELARSEILKAADDFAEMRIGAQRPDGAGRFVFTGVEPGRRTFVRAFVFEDPLNPSAPAFVIGGTKGSVVVEEGRTATLALGCEGIPLSGALLREGVPAAGRVVVFRGPGNREAEAMLDGAGAFSLLVPVPGAWSPWIDGPAGLGLKWAPVSCDVPPSGLSGCAIDLRAAASKESR